MIGDALRSFGVMAERFLRTEKVISSCSTGDFQGHLTPQELLSGEGGSIHLAEPLFLTQCP